MTSLLNELESNINLLLERNSALTEDNEQLKATIQQQREEIIRTHAELQNLKAEHKKLLAAYALTAESEQRGKAKRQITKLISLIDNALEQLAL